MEEEDEDDEDGEEEVVVEEEDEEEEEEVEDVEAFRISELLKECCPDCSQTTKSFSKLTCFPIA